MKELTQAIHFQTVRVSRCVFGHRTRTGGACAARREQTGAGTRSVGRRAAGGCLVRRGVFGCCVAGGRSTVKLTERRTGPQQTLLPQCGTRREPKKQRLLAAGVRSLYALFTSRGRCWCAFLRTQVLVLARFWRRAGRFWRASRPSASSFRGGLGCGLCELPCADRSRDPVGSKGSEVGVSDVSVSWWWCRRCVHSFPSENSIHTFTCSTLPCARVHV